MAEHWADTVFVQNDTGQVTGIVTDGIVWGLIAKEHEPRDPRAFKAKEIMFRNFIRVNADDPIDSIEQLRELFDKTKIQRIGLVKNDKIVGLVRKKFIEQIKRYSRNYSFTLK